MTPAPETVNLRCSIAEAYDIMQSLKVRHLPVVDDGKLVGILSERDLCIAKIAHGIDPTDIAVGEVMIRDIYTVEPDTPIEEAALAMVEGRFGSSVVLSRGEVAGIFTTTDALRVLVQARAAEEGQPEHIAD
ncbi:MAG: CBS domain-containing protein [Myxococcaceae bacterium]